MLRTQQEMLGTAAHAGGACEAGRRNEQASPALLPQKQVHMPPAVANRPFLQLA